MADLLVPVLDIGLQLLSCLLQSSIDGDTDLLHILISVNHLVNWLQNKIVTDTQSNSGTN